MLCWEEEAGAVLFLTTSLALWALGTIVAFAVLGEGGQGLFLMGYSRWVPPLLSHLSSLSCWVRSAGSPSVTLHSNEQPEHVTYLFPAFAGRGKLWLLPTLCDNPRAARGTGRTGELS